MYIGCRKATGGYRIYIYTFCKANGGNMVESVLCFNQQNRKELSHGQTRCTTLG